MKNICIVSHNAFGAITGGKIGHIGGVERQTSLMARWLAKRGYNVTFLTWDEGQFIKNEFGGVKIITMCKKNDGLPGLRFFHPRWSSLNRAMQKANADLYYQNCAEYFTGLVALWCRYKNRPFIYSVASDPECDPRLQKLKSLREKLLYKYGLTHADHIIVQTRKQRLMLKNGFDLNSTFLPMPCVGPDNKDFKLNIPSSNERIRVAWIGRICPVKRLELLLDVAVILKDIDFDVIGAPDIEDDYSKKVLSRARSIKNVTIHGKVKINEMKNIYEKTSLLCCTSISEGFPNTFLEAWSYGIPVVSTFNPDDLLAEKNIGSFCNNVSELVSAIRYFIDSEDHWLTASSNARRYYLKYHRVDSAMSQFEHIFRKVLLTKLNNRN